MGNGGSAGGRDETVETSKKLEAPANFSGATDRKCTDVLFSVLIVGMWVAMTVVGIESVQEGDPEILINGVDYKGRICGKSSGVEDLTKLYYVTFTGQGVCVASCPTTTDFGNLYACMDAYSNYTAAAGYSCDASVSTQAECLDLAGLTSASAESFTGTGDGACMYQLESTDFLNHCVFSDSDILDQFVSLSDDTVYIQQFLIDIYTARNWILGFGLCFSFTLGFVFCMLLRVPGVVALLVWTSILGITGILAGLGYGGLYLSDKWEEDGTHDDTQIKAAYWIGIILFVAAALWVCVVLFLRKRITLATGIVKESARAIGAMPVMILMPVIQCAGLAGFLVIWVVYAAYTASIATVTTYEGEVLGVSYEAKEYTYTDEIVYRGWFLLFCFFWTTQFIAAMGQIIIALTVVKYYFTRDKSAVGNATFLSSLSQGMIYHTGTAAFGSLVIAIIEMIRAVIAYFQKKARLAHNKIAEYALCCCACCFWCIEKCMKFINKNAYIQTAIFSTSFCTSCRNAFFLIARNIARVGALTLVSEFMIIVMKLFICVATMGATYLAMQKTIGDELYTVIGPTIFAGLIAYMVAEIFADLFSMTCLTILQCFIADEEMFSGSDRYAENDLKDWVRSNGGGGSKTPRAGSPREISTPERNTRQSSPRAAAVTGTQ